MGLGVARISEVYMTDLDQFGAGNRNGVRLYTGVGRCMFIWENTLGIAMTILASRWARDMDFQAEATD